MVAYCSQVVIPQTNYLTPKPLWDKTCRLLPLAACSCSSAVPVQRFVGLLQTRWPKCFSLQSSLSVAVAQLRDSEQQCRQRGEREHFQLIFPLQKVWCPNLTHRQRGIFTQDLYIRDECSNQRTSDERVPWILVLEKKSMIFFSFRKEKGLAPAFWLGIWILNLKQRETSPNKQQ